jgi:hypothetical protein
MKHEYAMKIKLRTAEIGYTHTVSGEIIHPLQLFLNRFAAF